MMETRSSRNAKELKRPPLKEAREKLYPEIIPEKSSKLYPHEALVNGEQDIEMEEYFEMDEDIEINEFEPHSMETDNAVIHGRHSPRLTKKEVTDRVLRARQNRGMKKEEQAPSKKIKRSNARDVPQSNPRHSHQNKIFDSSCLKALIPWLLMLLVISLSTAYYIRPPKSSLGLDIEGIISQLNASFAEQDPMSFKIIKKALERVSVTEPEAPAIIILLAAKGAENVSYAFAQHLVKSISSDYLTISGNHYRTINSHDGKKDIDNKIQEAVNDNELQAVLVKDLDLIPSKTALMFYTFCDHENAPYKRVVYVMTVTSQDKIPKEYSGSSWDVALENRLKTVWKDTHEDKIAPLLSRLTVSVVAITAK